MKIRLTTCFVLVLAAQILLAQQPAQYSLYRANKYAFNPGYAGLDNSLSLTGVYRSQWAGLPGNPVTQNFNAHMPLYIVGGAAGVAVENETLGSWRQTSFSATYAKQFFMGKTGLLSLGLSGGWVQRQLDGSKVRTPSTEIDDLGNINHNDNYLGSSLEGGAGYTAHLGAFYQDEKFEAGVAAVNLLGNTLNLSKLEFEQERTYFLYIGYQIDLNNKLSASPSFLLKTDVHQTQIDFSVTAQYNENIFVGASLRGYNPNSLDAVVLMGGFKLNEKISVAYAYDLGLSNLKTISTGSHEVLVNYNLGKPIGKGRPPAIIYNPRSL
ncbi:MAG: PorP/SprF family type IX secretion system membrane protein [Saprospiraceae bacterium]|nr:PorP/SprF family type IX secretion system membrane protein [Saprospiraceae bacterium]MCF8251879.1 PorP/SprF family type IX secretion system membrane protein [Saprospiraceae bacterium]MCF8283107.1 PorP/SprF family type IX secretion system membrane protein [Bacteroidales bacterium]MCF8313556.1 PorP/SprF family type IX secretion system membrane protein [Saprospiraceae bacterium]MCF8442627.1 PorP/SprF family type IX secretion system membrane protein [Saprospiraceae bacterium]